MRNQTFTVSDHVGEGDRFSVNKDGELLQLVAAQNEVGGDIWACLFLTKQVEKYGYGPFRFKTEQISRV